MATRFILVNPTSPHQADIIELSGESFLVVLEDTDPDYINSRTLRNAPDDPKFQTIALLGTHGLLEQPEA